MKPIPKYTEVIESKNAKSIVDYLILNSIYTQKSLKLK